MSLATRSSGVRCHAEEEVEAHEGPVVRRTSLSRMELGPFQRCCLMVRTIFRTFRRSWAKVSNEYDPIRRRMKIIRISFQGTGQPDKVDGTKY